MDIFLQQVLNGLTLGGIYSLVALGLTLVYGILHVPNFAHGAFYMVGAFVALKLMTGWEVNYWIAMAGAAGVVAVIGALSERLVFHPLRNHSGLHPMIAAIGLLLFLEAGAQALWGADFLRMPTPFSGIIEVDAVGVSVTFDPKADAKDDVLSLENLVVAVPALERTGLDARELVAG